MTIALIVAICFMVIWFLWILLALVKKSTTIFIFLLITGGLWSILEIWLGLADSPVTYVLLLVPLILLPSMVRIVNEYQRGVLFRLGRQRLLLGPGLNLVFPLGIDAVRKIDLRTFTIDVPKQEVITRDNVPVMVDAVIYFNVFDPALAVLKVADYIRSTSLLGQTILRSVLGQHDLDEMLGKRAQLNTVLQKLLDEATDPWGMKVTAVEMKTVELPESMKRAMAKQAEAERERRAKIISAEGEFQASEKIAAAAHIIGGESVGLQLRYLQTLTEIAVEKNSTILFPLPMEFLKFFDKLGKAQ
jgi:regulator of protease activity HflC (stomatin/prohibitin superfamily)